MFLRIFTWLTLLIPCLVYGQANGKLQIHFMDVGQGDGALLISPLGETVLFDNGVRRKCTSPEAYLDGIGVTKIDYHIASHYHADHIGCSVEILDKYQQNQPLKAAYDRGGHYKTETFTNYTNVVGGARQTAIEGSTLVLDANSANPVRIEFAALNGYGVANANNENDLSIACVVRFGQFDAVIAGDLSGYNAGGYHDVETALAPKIGAVEVYKVNHHGSKHSSNPTWLATLKPKIGVISAGLRNTHDHPTPECMSRLHQFNIKTYWTSEGGGVPPDPAWDKVGGNIVVEAEPGSTSFTVTYAWTEKDTYEVWNPITTPQPTGVSPQFAWSKKSQIYHISTCSYVPNISPTNLQTGNTPPPSKQIHAGCPKL